MLPDTSVTAGVTHVITAFAESNIFTGGSSYTPFMPLDQIRAMFDPDTKVCMAVGGWALSQGFGPGATDEQSRQQYAKNVAAAVEQNGYDCVGEIAHLNRRPLECLLTHDTQTSIGSILVATVGLHPAFSSSRCMLTMRRGRLQADPQRPEDRRDRHVPAPAR